MRPGAATRTSRGGTTVAVYLPGPIHARALLQKIRLGSQPGAALPRRVAHREDRQHVRRGGDPPHADLSLPASTASRQAAQVALDPKRLYRLIGMEPPAEQEALGPTVNTRPQTCNDATAAPVRTDLRLALVASVLSDQPRWSLATLLDLGTREANIYGVGDAVQGATLVGLQRVREDRDATGNGFKVVAILCNAGTKEFVDFEEGAGGGEGPNVGVAPLPAPRQFGGKPGTPMQGIRPVGDNKYEISRSVLDQQLSNLSTISTQARIVPSFENGVANGFKLFSIQPGSLSP